MIKKKLFLSFFIIINVVSNIYSSDEKITSQNLNSTIAKLESFVQEGMKQSHVPGVAIAIVYQGEVVYVKGFGYRNIEKKLEVTPNTIFQLASVSKPITSTILAILVGEAKIDWNSKIEQLNPLFRLSDPWVTSQLTIRDLLSHRSGLPDHAGDILEDLGYPEDEIYHRLRYIKPLNPFRASYAYTNFGFSEAAFASSKYLKTPWNDLAKEKLFAPLGMNDTSYSFDDYFTHGQKATTYFIDDGKVNPQRPSRNPDSQRPAGGVSSSANDIAKWMILQMGGFQKKKIVQEKALKATQTPVIVTGKNDKTGLPTFYGMGWDISYDPQGRYFLKHSGSFFMGVRTQVALLPKEKLG
ncbi:MAG: serine hydrolase domain-containing protein, partial [Chlamydiota bacterium]